MRELAITALVCAACSAMPDGTPTGSICPPTNPPTYQGFGRAFMAAYCTACHSSKASDRFGAPPDQDFDTDDDMRVHADEIDMVAAAGPNGVNTHMPELKGPVFVGPDRDERVSLGAMLACERQ